ncbi:MarR family winged helix-turn-helix transcriptional regulator [Dactylosporangium sp. NPDC051541]|uniref:MarR family winged helix-turn-helix transcriptional regulator n=1 Tax=Dactylosporangium sp. NPDC051541 TaxID=3363977 RepID=UPI0037A7835D
MMMTHASSLPFGTALALAQRVLTASLSAALDTENVTMPQWFTLNALGLRGSTSTQVLSNLLATNGLDPAAVQELLTTLDRAGLVEVRDGVVLLTTAGAARHAGLRDRIDLVTSRIFERFDEARVEIARSLLQEIAETDPEQLTHRSAQAGRP